MREKEIGKTAIGSGNSLSIRRLEISGEWAIVLTNGFTDGNGLFVEDDR